MKKTYIIPEAKVYEMKVQQQMLAGSTPDLNGGDYGGGTILAPELYYDEDF